MFGTLTNIYQVDSVARPLPPSLHGHTIGKDIGLVYLPLDLAVPGTEVEVVVLGESIRAQVVSTPLVDPKGERLRT